MDGGGADDRLGRCGQLDRVEDVVNDIIAQDRPVTMRTIPRAEAERLLAAGMLHKLPEREGDIRLIDSAFVASLREGLTVMIDEPNTIRDVALLSLNSVFDGRLALYLPATAETVIAAPMNASSMVSRLRKVTRYNATARSTTNKVNASTGETLLAASGRSRVRRI